jgi:hypothetical protein
MPDRRLPNAVRGSVEETLIALLDAEADRLRNARRYVHEARRDTRAGHYERKADQGWRGQAADTEASGADVRDGDCRALPAARELGRGGLDRDVSGRGLSAPGRDITEALWGTRVSLSTDLKAHGVAIGRLAIEQPPDVRVCNRRSVRGRCGPFGFQVVLQDRIDGGEGACADLVVMPLDFDVVIEADLAFLPFRKIAPSLSIGVTAAGDCMRRARRAG